jgi:hypothetical protein
MGETQHTPFPLDFNRSIVIEDRPERLTGEAGVLALRQIDHRLSLTDWRAARLTDPRNPDLITLPQVELFLESFFLVTSWESGQSGTRRRIVSSATFWSASWATSCGRLWRSGCAGPGWATPRGP